MKIGITGAEGHIGSVLAEAWSGTHELSLFTLNDQEFESKSADLSDSDQVNGLFTGLDAVVHLAADPEPTSPWESILPNNIAATYNVLEECRRAGVKKFVFATTNHTQHSDTMGELPDILDESKRKMIKLNDPLNPTSLYGVSKATGEQLGRYFATHHGIQFVGLRIGATGPSGRPTGDSPRPQDSYTTAMFLSHRDLVTAFTRAIEIDRDFILAYAISNNDSRIFDLTETNEQFGFYPQDNSANN